MSESLRACIDAHWHLANARDWPCFEALLSPEFRYEVPRTREYIDGASGYLDLFGTSPVNGRPRSSSSSLKTQRPNIMRRVRRCRSCVGADIWLIQHARPLCAAL